MFEKETDLMQNVKPEDFGLILNAIIHLSKAGIFVSDHNGDVVLINQASADMNGLPISDILGRNVKYLLRKGYSDRSVTLEVLKEKKTVSLINITKNNKKILTTGTPIFNTNGEIKFVFVNERDITFLNELKRLLEKDEFSGERSKISYLDSNFVKTELEGYVFESVDMQMVVQMAIQVAEYDMDVVITGESGVGKGVIANLIHKFSNRRKGPFVDVNCGAISENLIESELFGYEKGAFTGASKEGKRGYFEFADHGTIFLDEIGEIPMPLQVKLLKFLENKEITRVGGVQPKKIDTRIIAATNKDLKAAIKAGEFRKDLFFRLNVVPIHIPPLRRRTTDIEPLINFFLDRYNMEFKKNKTISEDVVDLLMEYDLPGNVRELRNLLKRLIIMTKSNTIDLTNLPRSIIESVNRHLDLNGRLNKTLKNAVRNFEAKLIIETVNKYGSQRKASKVLGVDQSTLSRKLQKLTDHKLIHE